MNKCQICNVYEIEHQTTRGKVCAKCQSEYNLDIVPEKYITVYIHNRVTITGTITEVTFALIEDDRVVEILVSVVGGLQTISETIDRVQAFFPDYKFVGHGQERDDE